MSLIKLIKKQPLYNTDESGSALANLSFNGREKKKKEVRWRKRNQGERRGASKYRETHILESEKRRWRVRKREGDGKGGKKKQWGNSDGGKVMSEQRKNKRRSVCGFLSNCTVAYWRPGHGDTLSSDCESSICTMHTTDVHQNTTSMAPPAAPSPSGSWLNSNLRRCRKPWTNTRNQI